jgi:hypothetical protein
MTVSELVLKRMEELDLTKEDIVRRMGYRKIEKGIAHLSAILNGSYLLQHQYAQITRALEVDKETVVQAMLETHRQEVLRETNTRRKAFRPHLCAMCDNRVPSPIFIGGMTYRFRFIYLEPYFMELPAEVQKAEAGKMIREHFAERNGYISGFGRILHYVLRMDFDEKPTDMLFFNTQGEQLLNTDNKLQCYPGEPMGLFNSKGRDIDFLLKLQEKRQGES